MYLPGIISTDVLSILVNSLDYLPVASTVKSLAHIIHKVFQKPNEHDLSPSPHTFYPLNRGNKGYCRDITLLVPVLGNIVIYLWDSLATVRGDWFYSRVNNNLILYISALDKAASYGNVHAMVLLGNELLDGIRCEKDEKLAVSWYKQAADLGSYEALNGLGTCQEQGIECLKNVEKAFDLYSKAAKQGNELATNNVLRLLSSDNAIKKYPHSEDVLKNLAEQGNNVAMETLGDLYNTGLHKDEDQAIEWYSKASDSGNKKAWKKLKQLAHFHPLVNQIKDAKRLIHQGEPEKMFERGKETLYNGLYAGLRSVLFEPKDALALLRKAAAVGNPKIQVEVGKILQAEVSCRDPSYSQEAVTLFLKALKKDPTGPAAYYLIGSILWGRGLREDRKEGEELLAEYNGLSSAIWDFMQESKKHLQLPAARNELCKLFSGVLKYRPDQGLIAELTKEPYRSKTALRVLRNRYRPGGVKYQKPLIPPQNQNKKTETDLRRAFYEFEQYAKEGDIQAKYELALCFLEGKGAPISLDKAKPLLEELVWHKKCPHPLKVEKLLKTYFPLSPLPQKDPADQYGPSKLGPLIVEFANKVKRSVEHHKLK